MSVFFVVPAKNAKVEDVLVNGIAAYRDTTSFVKQSVSWSQFPFVS
jgi:hypothetical protein